MHRRPQEVPQRDFLWSPVVHDIKKLPLVSIYHLWEKKCFNGLNQ